MTAKQRNETEPKPLRAPSKGVIVPSSVAGYVGVRLSGVTYLVLEGRVDEFFAAMKAGDGAFA